MRAIDHHCHPLRRWPFELTALELRACFTEALDPRVLRDHVPATAAYRDALRRLGADHEETILAARAAADPGEYANGLLERCGTGCLLLDFGFQPAESWSPEEHRREVHLPQYEIVRVEPLAERLVADCATPGDWIAAVREGLRSSGAVAVKTIAAYRASLRLRRPAPSELRRDYAELRRQRRPRVAGNALCHALVFAAAEECVRAGLPLQVHCGLGDPDEDLAEANPLGLRRLFTDPGLDGLRVALLHCYPYHREAAYLCAMFPGVYMDLSLAFPLAGADAGRALREALGLCPWTKLLYATDASRIPELYFVAAQLEREALAGALAEILDFGAAMAAGRQVLVENARALYRLPADS